MAMKEEVIQDISKQIYRRFPAVEGKKPRVKQRQIPEGRSISKAPTFLFTYHSRVKLPANRSLPYWVRVVVDKRGKIMKITTSR